MGTHTWKTHIRVPDGGRRQRVKTCKTDWCHVQGSKRDLEVLGMEFSDNRFYHVNRTLYNNNFHLQCTALCRRKRCLASDLGIWYRRSNAWSRNRILFSCRTWKSSLRKCRNPRTTCLRPLRWRPRWEQVKMWKKKTLQIYVSNYREILSFSAWVVYCRSLSYTLLQKGPTTRLVFVSKPSEFFVGIWWYRYMAR